MGSKNRQNSFSFFSFFKLFKFKKSKKVYQIGSENGGEKKVWPSDEDKGSWGVGDPHINKLADEFISRGRRKSYECEHCQLDSAHTG